MLPNCKGFIKGHKTFFANLLKAQLNLVYTNLFTKQGSFFCKSPASSLAGWIVQNTETYQNVHNLFCKSPWASWCSII